MKQFIGFRSTTSLAIGCCEHYRLGSAPSPSVVIRENSETGATGVFAESIADWLAVDSGLVKVGAGTSARRFAVWLRKKL